MMKKIHNAFTLVEVIVAVAIVGIVSGATVVTVKNAYDKEQDNNAVRQAQLLDISKQDYLAQNGEDAITAWEAAADDQAKYELLKSVLPKSSASNFADAVPEGYDFALNGIYDATTVTDSNGEKVGDAEVGTRYELTLDAKNESGPATPVGGVAIGSGSYVDGSDVTVFARSLLGYEFVEWEDSGGAQVSTDASFTKTISGSDASLTAVFAPKADSTYTLTVVPNVSAGGTVTGSGAFDSGDTANISASASSGYVFDEWQGDVSDPTASATTVTMDQSKTVTGIFTKDIRTLTVNISDASMGSATGGGSYALGNTALIEAIPADTYEFVSWTGDVEEPTSSTTTVLMDSNKTVTATFQPIPDVTLTVESILIDGSNSQDGKIIAEGSGYSEFTETGLPQTYSFDTSKGSVLDVRAGVVDNNSENVLFNRWFISSGGATSSVDDPFARETQLLINEDTTLTAEFGTPEQTGATADGVGLASGNVIQPELTVEVNGDGSVRLTGTDFAFSGEIQSHVSSDWQVSSASDFSSIDQSSIEDTNNLTSIVIPSSALSTPLNAGSVNYARVRYNGTLSTSAYSSSKSIALPSSLLSTPTISGEVTYSSGYELDLSGSAFTVSAGSDSHDNTNWRISSDVEGEDILFEANNSPDLLNTTIAQTDVSTFAGSGDSVYASVSYNGNTGQSTSYSDPVELFLPPIPANLPPWISNAFYVSNFNGDVFLQTSTTPDLFSSATELASSGNTYAYEVSGQIWDFSNESLDGLYVNKAGKNAENVQSLFASGNTLSQFDTDIPDNITSIELVGNNLTSIDLDTLPANLVSLNIEDNNIDTINGRVLPSTLAELNAAKNSIQIADILPALNNLPSGLKTLSLSNNNISTWDGSLMPANLEVLDLANNNISSFAGSNSLPSSLKSLFLQKNDITDFDVSDLPSRLSKLILWGNAISDVADIDKIANNIWDFVASNGVRNGVLALQGGTNSGPSPDSLRNINKARNQGWTVTTEDLIVPSDAPPWVADDFYRDNVFADVFIVSEKFPKGELVSVDDSQGDLYALTINSNTWELSGNEVNKFWINHEGENFTSVTDVILADNNLSDWETTIYPPNLEVININSNKYDTFATNDLPPGIKSFDISNNRNLKNDGIDFANLPNSIKSLNVSSTGIDTLNESALPSQIEEIIASNNNINSYDSTINFPELLTLNLSENNLTNTIKAYRLRNSTPKLKVLDLGSNNMTYFDLTLLPSNLEVLNIRSNGVTSAPSNPYWNANSLPSSLKFLNIGNNDFGGSFDFWDIPRNLEILNAGRLGLSSSQADFDKLPKSIRELRLRENSTGNQDFGKLADLNNLEVLSIQSNGRSNMANAWKLPSSLRVLNLDFNNIGSSYFDIGALPKGLQTITLWSNGISSSTPGFNPSEISKYPKLQVLNLNNNSITNLNLSNLANSLRRLDINSNGVTLNLTVESGKTPTNLVTLNLSNTQVTDFGNIRRIVSDTLRNARANDITNGFLDFSSLDPGSIKSGNIVVQIEELREIGWTVITP